MVTTAPTPLVDPVAPTALPLILNDAYFELTGVNLRCLVQHLEIAPETGLVTVTSFCSEVDYPGATKWHLRVTFYQSFDTGATYDTLSAALAAYQSAGTLAPFKARPYASRPTGATNPEITGDAVPVPFDLLAGDAGAASQVQIDWSIQSTPTVVNALVLAQATGAVAGSPGYFNERGAQVPADLSALEGLSAYPAAPWSSGQYVITKDLLAAHWDGNQWTTGKA